MDQQATEFHLLYMLPNVTSQVTWLWESRRRVCRSPAWGVTLLVSTIVVGLAYDEIGIPG